MNKNSNNNEWLKIADLSDKSLKHPKEWFEQAEYDLITAESMFQTKRYIYTVFMCHLSIEKTLKGLYVKELKAIPPKTHSLIYLIEKLSLQLPKNLYNFVSILNRVSVPTRYPYKLRMLLKVYDKNKTKEILETTQEIIKWLKTR